MARHDADAGGDPELLAVKAALREQVWAALDQPGIARFPKPVNRIPNFVGAEAAARRLAETDEWAAAATVKSNPDSPQWPVRQRALRDGKLVYMAVPRLAELDPFFLLDPDDLADDVRTASSIKGASKSARTVAVADLEPVDLVVTGCVAVDASGARLGKGGGFSDLEFALAAEAGLVGPHTIVATTVHERQVLPAGAVPTAAHDLHVDLVVTADEVLRCARPGSWSLPVLRWDELTEEKIAAIPLLAQMRAARPNVRKLRAMDVSKYQHSDSVVVAAVPDAVYALVADVTNMGALSPVCQSAQWSGDERDTFTGTNVVGEREWTTHCRVDVAEAGEEFTFTNRGTDGDRDLVRWSYRFAPTDGGTEVTETWQVLPEFVDQIQQLAPDADIGQILDGMVPGTQQGIATTLANLKAMAEA